MTGFDWWMSGCVLLIVVASLGESWCLRQVISGITDDCRRWRRRAEHYHEHAMGERERANRAEIELDKARRWDMRSAGQQALDAMSDDERNRVMVAAASACMAYDKSGGVGQ